MLYNLSLWHLFYSTDWHLSPKPNPYEWSFDHDLNTDYEHSDNYFG
jgi:hypothetical protein